MSNDELIARARKSYRSLDGVVVVSPHLIKDLADALESIPAHPLSLRDECQQHPAHAAAEEPREVTTVEELDALPEYVVVFDRVHGVARKLGHEWSLDGMNGWWPSEQLEIRYGLPLTILFTPSTEETP